MAHFLLSVLVMTFATLKYRASMSGTAPLEETFIDVEPACQHWFDPPSGLWGFWPFKKFNDFYTFWITIFYSIYKIAMAVT